MRKYQKNSADPNPKLSFTLPRQVIFICFTLKWKPCCEERRNGVFVHDNKHVCLVKAHGGGGVKVKHCFFYLRQTDPSKNKTKSAFLNRDANETSFFFFFFFVGWFCFIISFVLEWKHVITAPRGRRNATAIFHLELKKSLRKTNLSLFRRDEREWPSFHNKNPDHEITFPPPLKTVNSAKNYLLKRFGSQFFFPSQSKLHRPAKRSLNKRSKRERTTHQGG